MALSAITESFKNEQKILEILKAVLSEFWGETTTGGGQLVSAQLMCIKTKAEGQPFVRQYPIPLEAGKSIQNQIDQYLDTEIFKADVFAYNTPILPVNQNRLNEDPEYLCRICGQLTNMQ